MQLTQTKLYFGPLSVPVFNKPIGIVIDQIQGVASWISIFVSPTVFETITAALFEISVSRSRNFLHRCYGWVKYAPYAMPRTTFYASQKPFKQQK